MLAKQIKLTAHLVSHSFAVGGLWGILEAALLENFLACSVDSWLQKKTWIGSFNFSRSKPLKSWAHSNPGVATSCIKRKTTVCNKIRLSRLQRSDFQFIVFIHGPAMVLPRNPPTGSSITIVSRARSAWMSSQSDFRDVFAFDHFIKLLRLRRGGYNIQHELLFASRQTLDRGLGWTRSTNKLFRQIRKRCDWYGIHVWFITKLDYKT